MVSRNNRKRFMSWGAILLLTVAVGFMAIHELLIERPATLQLTSAGSVDMCLSCHKDEKLDTAHDAKVIGCAPCHLGNPLAIEKEKAHAGMVINPGDLRHADRTCSTEGCHPADIHKVKNSLMATNRGILGTLLYYWGETESQDTELTVEDLLESGETSLALDYFRKLCATCHLWKQKNDLEGAPQFFNEKGGGCTACHFHVPADSKTSTQSLEGDNVISEEDEKKQHPHITAAVSQVNCIRCHNRSGRIGLSYIGIFESEGYGTPYEKGGMSSKQLPGARFYLEIADDIHHRKGMECIDCHTREEIMGDGTSYAHYEDQLEISCEVCHSETPGVTRKDRELNNVEQDDIGYTLYGKIDKKKRPLKTPKKGVCDFTPHKRVTCEACHSTWVPQCYGCHVKQDKREVHLDKLTLTETPGLWEEGRSYIRYEKPMLGMWNEDVVIVTPGCQDIVTMVDEKGVEKAGFNRFTMAAINPHTTQEQGRSCVDCHVSPKTVGLGEGTISESNGELVFTRVDRGTDSVNGVTPPFDGYVTIKGEPLQYSSRPEVRPFNGEELERILRVGLCVDCHNRYDDPVWKEYKTGMKCRRSPEPEIVAE
ncbi:amino acid ABC transporter substrate-binding protein [Desulfopila sp. IMCC35008]|uniref:amino acid ABC transporter substrate-binding protein n=1 Tax=Desulfopila sp. IMCC35008 TaxID=2653858 RepID=UPI0013D38333|nr:amino acid ABC transporter substrate-binding protein [Desulfopila sp. IMCC35008]